MTDEPNDPSSIRLEDLVAHAEGRLPAGSALRTRVEEHLRHHPEDATRVEAFRRQDELLHEAFDDIMRQPLPSRLQERLQRPERSQPQLAIAASLVLGIAVGWGVAQVEYAPDEGDAGGSLAEQTAQHLTGTARTVDAETVTASDAGGTLLPDGAPDLSSVGLTTTGGTALENPAEGLRRYEYRDNDGRTFQLLVSQDSLIDPASVYTLRNGDFTLAYWHQDNNTYLLGGAIEPERLEALAHESMAALDPGKRASDSEKTVEIGDSFATEEVVAGNQDTGQAGNGDTIGVEDTVDPIPVIDQM